MQKDGSFSNEHLERPWELFLNFEEVARVFDLLIKEGGINELKLYKNPMCHQIYRDNTTDQFHAKTPGINPIE
jgi:hypothetical protein